MLGCSTIFPILSVHYLSMNINQNIINRKRCMCPNHCILEDYIRGARSYFFIIITCFMGWIWLFCVFHYMIVDISWRWNWNWFLTLQGIDIDKLKLRIENKNAWKTNKNQILSPPQLYKLLHHVGYVEPIRKLWSRNYNIELFWCIKRRESFGAPTPSHR